MKTSMFEQYLVPAAGGLMCIDDRKRKPTVRRPHLPGAVYALVDALKAILMIDEEAAWEAIERAGIRLDVHVDDEHPGAPWLGCGYAKQVQENPAAVSAPQAVPAEVRFQFAKDGDGRVTKYFGPHNKHCKAVLNLRKGMTIDQMQALADGHPVFVCDPWIAKELAPKLGVDAERLAAEFERQFRATVFALAGITKLIVIDE